MKMDQDNLPVFDEDTIYEITLDRRTPGRSGYRRGDILVKNRNGATRGMFGAAGRYMFPQGTRRLIDGLVQDAPMGSVAPTLREQIKTLEEFLSMIPEDGPLHKEFTGELAVATTRLEQTLALAKWWLKQDQDFTASTPVFDPELDSIFEEGDERILFVLLFRFLDSLSDHDLVIRESDIRVLDR